VSREIGEARIRQERREGEKALRESEERLREARRLESIGLLAAGIAQDFNNILTAVIGNISLALDEPGTAKHIETFLRNSMESCERAAGLTRQLLAYAGKGMDTQELVVAFGDR